jgi:hypothetical protein
MASIKIYKVDGEYKVDGVSGVASVAHAQGLPDAAAALAPLRPCLPGRRRRLLVARRGPPRRPFAGPRGPLCRTLPCGGRPGRAGEALPSLGLDGRARGARRGARPGRGPDRLGRLRGGGCAGDADGVSSEA